MSQPDSLGSKLALKEFGIEHQLKLARRFRELAIVSAVSRVRF